MEDFRKFLAFWLTCTHKFWRALIWCHLILNIRWVPIYLQGSQWSTPSSTVPHISMKLPSICHIGGRVGLQRGPAPKLIGFITIWYHLIPNIRWVPIYLQGSQWSTPSWTVPHISMKLPSICHNGGRVGLQRDPAPKFIGVITIQYQLNRTIRNFIALKDLKCYIRN